jgi:hypothetical protein
VAVGDWWIYTLWIAGAYLFGAIPVVYLIGRIRGVDLSKEEDMHISLWRNVGRVEGLIGVSWDVAKGGIAVVVVDRAFHLEPGLVAAVGLGVIVGEMWPIFLDFRGEKANTTGLGMAAALAYQAIPFLVTPIALGALIRTLPRFLDSRRTLDERLRFGGPPSYSLPLGMLCGFALFPLGCWVMGLPWEIIAAGIVLFALIVIKRLVTGLREDLETGGSRWSILVNRFLFDRSFL